MYGSFQVHMRKHNLLNLDESRDCFYLVVKYLLPLCLIILRIFSFSCVHPVFHDQKRSSDVHLRKCVFYNKETISVTSLVISVLANASLDAPHSTQYYKLIQDGGQGLHFYFNTWAYFKPICLFSSKFSFAIYFLRLTILIKDGANLLFRGLIIANTHASSMRSRVIV